MPNEIPTYTALFSLDTRTIDGDYVVRSGKVFELGEWADKGFALNEAEADAAIAAFTPVENDLEHRSTILDGKLGKLDSIKRVGTEILGSVRVPKWLDALQGEKPIGVSLAWNAEKRVMGNALTLNPRITGAQIAAAFSAESDFEATEAFDFFTEFAGRRNSNKDLSDIQAVHDLTLKLGAKCSETPAEEAAEKKTPAFSKPKENTHKMKVRELLAMFGLGDKPDLDADLGTPTPPTASAPVVPPAATPPASFSAENEALKAEIKVARDANLMTAAKSFCAELRASHKITPAQEPAIIAAFCMSARDDARGKPGHVEGLACFSATGDLVEGERVAGLRAQYAVAPALNFTEELLEGTEQTVLFDNGETATLTPEAIKKYLGQSELGRSALQTLKEIK